MDSICTPPDCEDIFAEEAGGPCWPRWLEGSRVPDAPRAAAYEATPAHLRAAVKTALALHHAHHGDTDVTACRDERFPRRGFRRTSAEGPAAHALVAFPASLRSPARLAAALMPAILAGVPLTGAFCIGGEPSPEVLVTLELAGVEDAFALAAGDFVRLTDELPRCRVVLLHGLDRAALPGRSRLPGRVWSEDALPLLLLPQADAVDAELLAFAHGPEIVANALRGADARAVLDGGTAPGDRLPAALLDGEGAARLAVAPGDMPVELLLTPGCEAFWLHPGLGPDFFRCHHRAFSLL
ncbi:hypothetical protein [uncultured Desulfovibrio sp.]|uniref:hypothetical protein n=1 Tax=uncultured Desulfovibrio sp. TaxID=167968 RepID=UPI002638F27A|nr:hypothetical protein [uncultured Desulfovibrio sp.]